MDGFNLLGILAKRTLSRDRDFQERCGKNGGKLKMGKFVKNKSGIIVPKEKEKAPEPVSYPIKRGWTFSLCGQIHYNSQEDWFKKQTLENMYAIINSLKYWGELKEDRFNECEDLLNQLAVEILGGVPDGFETYT